MDHVSFWKIHIKIHLVSFSSELICMNWLSFKKVTLIFQSESCLFICCKVTCNSCYQLHCAVHAVSMHVFIAAAAGVLSWIMLVSDPDFYFTRKTWSCNFRLLPLTSGVFLSMLFAQDITFNRTHVLGDCFMFSGIIFEVFFFRRVFFF